MGTALVVISGLGIFLSIGIFIISIILKVIFAISKKSEKKNKANKSAKISAIVFGVFLITFIVTMIVGPKLDPVGWCSHEYGVIEQQDSTCVNNGYIKKVCPKCNDEIIENIDAYHSWIEETVAEATCSTQKQIKKTCTRCEIIEYEKIGNLLEHSWTEDGVIEATCTQPKQLIKKCTVCKTTETIKEGSTLPHSFGDWKIDRKASTELEGQQSRKCKICKHVEYSSILKISPITILKQTYNIDTVGGVEWTTKIKNNSKKTIKYITLKWRCYNAVGDPIYDEIDGENIVGIRITGPLNSGKSGSYTNSRKFYNHSFASSTIIQITVEFMDGEVVDVTSNEYSDIFK